MDAALAKEVKHKLIKLIDEKEDSLRFYYLGDHYKTKVEHFGIKPSVDVEEPMIF
jgi:CRISPR-associated protein Cas2